MAYWLVSVEGAWWHWLEYLLKGHGGILVRISVEGAWWHIG